jgi:hypothetical protein
MSRAGAGLPDAVGASAAGIFRPAGDGDAQLRRDPVEPLRDVLADDMKGAAAGAGLAFRLDDDLLARQMPGQMAAIGATLFDSLITVISLRCSASASSRAKPVSTSSSARLI